MSEQELTAITAKEACNYNVHEFVQGQRDCRDGVKHFDGKGESYDAGFNFEYQMEQILGGKSGS